MPHEAAETRPLLWDQAAVSREAHWRQGCLCQWVWGTVPCCRAVCSAGERGPRAPRLLRSLPDPQFPGAAGCSPQGHLAGIPHEAHISGA